MEFRKTTQNDIEQVVNIYQQASLALASRNVDQWQGDGPCKESLVKDMSHGVSYVVVDNDEVLATCMIDTNKDPCYDFIVGAWPDDNPYIVIHRVATKQTSTNRGLASFCFQQAALLFPTFPSIRIDTHPDNQVMQHVLRKNGFVYYGDIYLESGALRNAFQKNM